MVTTVPLLHRFAACLTERPFSLPYCLMPASPAGTAVTGSPPPLSRNGRFPFTFLCQTAVFTPNSPAAQLLLRASVSLPSLPQAAVKGVLGQQSLAALLPLPAATISLDDTQAAANASRRLQVFGWVSYGLVIVLLAGAGFAELLYIGQDTFRANAWGDYLAVLAWGFGAEVSRTALADLLKGWGVPSFL